MKINATEFAEIGTEIAKQAAKAEPVEKAKLLDKLELLKAAAETAADDGSEEIEVDIKKLDVKFFDAQEAAERTTTGGVASNVDSITKAEDSRRDNLRKGLDGDGFPDDFNSDSKAPNFGVDPWLEK